MEKSVIFVCAIALSVTCIAYGDSGGCEIPKIAGGSLREERLGDWKWDWRRYNWARTVDHIMIRSGSTVSSSTILWLYCDKPYSVHGNGMHRVQTSCLGGKWSTELQCLLDYVSCPEFTLTPGLNVTYSKDLSVGSIASFECSLPTKDLNGSSSSICQENGSWSNPLPSCEVVRDQKCSIHDLTMSVPESVEPDMSKVTEEYVMLGFEVNLKCADRSVITGDSKAKCEKQGKWKLGIFQCVPGCVLNLDESSHLLVEPKKEGYRIGERISLSCPPGEVLSSDVEQLMCLSGYWSPAVPKCNEVEKKSGL